jgi:hypothetical protein
MFKKKFQFIKPDPSQKMLDFLGKGEKAKKVSVRDDNDRLSSQFRRVNPKNEDAILSQREGCSLCSLFQKIRGWFTNQLNQI